MPQPLLVPKPRQEDARPSLRCSLLEWLIRNIHREGQRYSASELVQKVTGKPLSHEPLMQQLRSKYGPLYGLS